MTNHNQKKQDEKNSGISAVTAAVTGAIIGAGVIAAGTVALKDKKNRKKVKEMLVNIKDQAIDYIGDMQKQASDKKGEAEVKVKKK